MIVFKNTLKLALLTALLTGASVPMVSAMDVKPEDATGIAMSVKPLTSALAIEAQGEGEGSGYKISVKWMTGDSEEDRDTRKGFIEVQDSGQAKTILDEIIEACDASSQFAVVIPERCNKNNNKIRVQNLQKNTNEDSDFLYGWQVNKEFNEMLKSYHENQAAN